MSIVCAPLAPGAVLGGWHIFCLHGRFAPSGGRILDHEGPWGGWMDLRSGITLVDLTGGPTGPV